MAITTFLHHFQLLKCTHRLPSISHFHLLKCFSSLPTNYSNRPHSPNLFAEFALNNFKLSHPDIAQIFKRAPSLHNLKTLQNVELFVDMLSRHGFTRSQIAQIMKKQPELMAVSAERLLEPKLQFFKDLGIQGEDLASMVVRRPRILASSLENNLQPTMAFLKDVFQDKGMLVKAILRNPIILARNLDKTLKPSLAFWEGFGLHGKELADLLSLFPDLLLYSSLTPAKAELISKIRIAADRRISKYVLSMVVRTSIEMLERKIHMFQQCGLTSQETMDLLRVAPQAFNYSEEKVRQRIDFIVNNMELPANSVVKVSCLLGCSLDKVLKPRFLVLQKLESIGGDINIKSLSTVLTMTEASFVSKIVEGHPESAILYAIYQDALSDALSTTKNSTKV